MTMDSRNTLMNLLLPLLYGIFILFPMSFIFNDTGIILILGILFLFLLLLINLKYSVLLFIITIIITDHYFPSIGLGQTLRERNVLLLLLLLHFLLLIIVNKKYDLISNTPREFIYILIIVAAATIHGLVIKNNIEWVKQDFVWSLFLLSYFPIAIVFEDKKNIIVSVALLCIVTTIMAIISIVTYFRSYERVISNAEVFFPIVLLIAITLLAINKLSIFKKIAIIILIIVNILAVIVSFTRSMWIATFGGVLILTFYLFKSGVLKMKKEILIKVTTIITVSLMSLLITTILIPALWIMIQTRFAMIFVGGRDWSVLYRIIEYKETIETVLKNPLFGGGLGAVIYTPLNITTQARLCFGTPYVHNSLLYWILKYGILGAGLCAFLWMKLIIKMYAKIKKECAPINKALMMGVLSSIPMLLIYSLSSPHISINTGQFFIGFTLAVFFPLRLNNE